MTNYYIYCGVETESKTYDGGHWQDVFVPVLKWSSSALRCYLSELEVVLEIITGIVLNVSPSPHHRPITTTALPHRSDILITVHSSLSFTVQIGQPIEMSNTFSCLFMSFMLTLPLHEVMIPLFFSSFFPSTNGSLLLLFFLFHFIPPLLFSFDFVDCFFFFWQQQVGIDQGDIPDLSQVSVHLTFHLLFLLSLTPTHFSPPSSYYFFPTFLQNCVWLHCLLFATLHSFSPLHIPVFTPFYKLLSWFCLLHPLPTHFFLFQTTASSNLMWLQATPLWFDWFPALSYTFKALL